MVTDFRLKIRNFWRKHKYKIVIGLFIWLIIIILNYILGNIGEPVMPSTSYSPHEALMDTEEEVPSSAIKPIEDWTNSFFTACNNKEYETAYNMLSSMYKDENSLEKFKAYVDDIYDSDKTYIIQDYSNKNGIYIYQVKIMDNILATGLNSIDDLKFVEEKVVVKKDGNNFEFSIGDKILEEELNKVFENEHMKVTVTQKQTFYDSEIYTLKITNPTDYIIVLNDAVLSDAIKLDLGDVQRKVAGEADIYIEPESTAYIDLKFNKFFDDDREAKAIKFDAVRIYESEYEDGEYSEYTGYLPVSEAIRRYSFTIDL